MKRKKLAKPESQGEMLQRHRPVLKGTFWDGRISLDRLACQAAISKSSLQAYEADRSIIPGDRVRAVASVYSIEPVDLLTACEETTRRRKDGAR